MPVSPHDVAPTPSPPPTEARPFVCHLNARGLSSVPTSTPSPSLVHARGPSSVPTSTPSPSPAIANMPTDEDATNLAMEDHPLNDCPMIMLINGAPKKSRAFEKGVCMHTGGSISLQDHVIRLSEELGQSVYVDDVFQQTHLRKDTGQFVNDRSRQTHEEFEARLSQARSDTTSSVGESQLTPLDPTEEQRLRSRCWVATAGPKCKGHLYGTGDLAHAFKCENENFMQHIQGFSSGAKDVAEIN
ncbi:hypothetical protein JHK85_006951 [Glycine max]|nr:hypothetical protein JHK85_006951 [Glycine max]